MPHRVLLVTYYFPPSGGPGVQRALKFAKYLPEFGWEPVVLTVREEDAAYPAYDHSLFQDVSPHLRIERTRAWDPYAMYARMLGKKKEETVGVAFAGESEITWKHQLARWIRANLFLPDARVGWVPFAIRRGGRLLEEGDFSAIVTTGPPHSSHFIGRLLSRRSGLPWVADFRDPWTGIHYAEKLPTTAPARRIDEALERKVLSSADCVTTVSPALVQDLLARHLREYRVIYNGFDPTDFPEPPAVLPDEFVVSYIGSLNEQSNPQALWQALSDLNAPVRMPRLRVHLVGNIDSIALRSAEQYGLTALLKVEPYVPHTEAIDKMMHSALLLLVINRAPNVAGVVTGKVFEYIASGRPVLGIGPGHGDAAAILEESRAGKMFDYADVDAIARFLDSHYQAWISGKAQAGASPEAIQTFSRKHQTGLLAEILDQV